MSMKISVALCTYNGSQYLTRQLDSILTQLNYIPDEIIICDDKSSDTTLAILNDYTILYPGIFKVYVNEINLGSTKNFEKAISLCSGDYIFLSDQDDIWKSDKVTKTIHHFENNPNLEGVFSNADLIDENDVIINNKTLWDCVSFFENELEKPIDILSLIATNGNIATGATMCITKFAIDGIIPFLKNSGNLHDEIIAKKIAFSNKLGYISENLISYRIHKSQQIGIKKTNQKKKKIRLKRILLGLKTPKSIFDYRYLFIKYYSRYKTYLNLHENIRLTPEEKKNQFLLIEKSKIDCFTIMLDIKKLNIILYYYYLTIDKLSKKRQF